MSKASPTTSGHFQAAGDDFPFSHWEPTSSYLTDGRTLYRYVGGVPSGSGELVALENCRSLKLMLFSLDELRALGLREVRPSYERVAKPYFGLAGERGNAGDSPARTGFPQ